MNKFKAVNKCLASLSAILLVFAAMAEDVTVPQPRKRAEQSGVRQPGEVKKEKVPRWLPQIPQKEVPPEMPVTGYAKLEYWRKGGVKAPTLKNALVEGVGIAVIGTAITQRKYQNLTIDLPEAVDLSKIEAISFDFGQNIRVGRAGVGSMVIRYDARNGLMADFRFGADEWNKVRIPIDLRTLKSLSKQNQPMAGNARSIQFSLFSNWQTPEQFLGVANLSFEPKKAETGPIKVRSYTYVSRPTGGDKNGDILTDGKTEASNQATFRQYSDDPDIIFDLGALYLVKSISLSAVAAPSQNIAGAAVYASADGKQWRLADFIRNTDYSSTVKEYLIEKKGMDILGRHIRLKCDRARTDFPLSLAEVSFQGKIPNDAELAAAADKGYDEGPELPPVNAQNYVTLEDGGKSFSVCRSNGVVVDFRVEGQLIARRIFSRYGLSDGKHIQAGDSYGNRVKEIQSTGKEISVLL
ncbi:MAG: discoidin domain-containing protein, partial [Victivallales bacterium]|nr:discoidin domain-containing protein [Victivallales bacterium]